jgi:hypothetical protein
LFKERETLDKMTTPESLKMAVEVLLCAKGEDK